MQSNVPSTYSEQIQQIPVSSEARKFIPTNSMEAKSLASLAPLANQTEQNTSISDASLENSFNNGFVALHSDDSNLHNEGTKVHGDKLLAEEENFQRDLEGGRLDSDSSRCIKEDGSSKLQGDALLWNSRADSYSANNDWKNNAAYESKNDSYSFGGKCPSEIIEQEEQERRWRVNRGVDPVAWGRVIRLHKELLDSTQNWYWTSGVKDVKSSLSESAESLKENLKEKGEHIKEKLYEKGEHLKERSESFTDTLYNLKDQLRDSTSHYIEVAKDSLGLNPSSLKSITRLEEKERERRMHEKVDPMIDARKRKVEEELLSSVKSC